MSEQWRDIPGYEGRYQISDMGRLQSKARGVWAFMPGSKGGSHYQRVGLSRPGDRSPCPVPVHHLVLLAFVGPRPEGCIIRHLNGKRYDNRLTNLVYGTHAENTQDMIRHGNHVWANITHCPHGHEYSPENTYVRPNGNRKCRKCNRDNQRAANQLRRALTPSHTSA